ncbi:MAG: hypothetical protein HY282_08460 [Nitrospirae bacterium]|nr:hypothetical protein [Candidatus Manganitrophaceae bacterium]
MLFIQINSLPFEQGREIGAILTGISHDFSEGVGIDLAQVIAIWEYLEPWHYAVAGRTAVNQPDDLHPILVELLVPDFDPPERIEKMLECLAASIAARVRIPKNNIFINVTQAASGRMFYAGEIVRW